MKLYEDKDTRNDVGDNKHWDGANANEIKRALLEVDEEQKLIVKALDNVCERLRRLEGHTHEVYGDVTNEPVSDEPTPPCPFKKGDRAVLRCGADQVGTVIDTQWRPVDQSWQIKRRYDDGTVGWWMTASMFILYVEPAPKFKVGDWVQPKDRKWWTINDPRVRAFKVVRVKYAPLGSAGNYEIWRTRPDGLELPHCHDNECEPYVPLPDEKVVVVMDDGTRVPGEFDTKMEALTFVRPPWAYMSVGIENRRIDHIEPDLEAK